MDGHAKFSLAVLKLRNQASSRLSCQPSISRWRGTGCENAVVGAYQIRPASSDGEFSDFTDASYFTASEIPVEIQEILLKFAQRFTLSPVVREILEIAEPHFTILPVDVPDTAHSTILALDVTWIRNG
jgi:hypothetical protein